MREDWPSPAIGQGPRSEKAINMPDRHFAGQRPKLGLRQLMANRWPARVGRSASGAVQDGMAWCGPEMAMARESDGPGSPAGQQASEHGLITLPGHPFLDEKLHGGSPRCRMTAKRSEESGLHGAEGERQRRVRGRGGGKAERRKASRAARR